MIPKTASASALASIAAHLGIALDELELSDLGDDELLAVLDGALSLAVHVVARLAFDTGRQLLGAALRYAQMERHIYAKRARKASAS